MSPRARAAAMLAQLGVSEPVGARTADALLADRIRAGEVAAFDEMVRAHYAPLRGFILTHIHSAALADEIVQDVFFNIWRNHAAWELRHSLRTYLFAAGKNAVRLYRRHATVVEREEREAVRNDLALGMGVGSVVPDAAAHRADIRDAVQQALATLPMRARQAATLRLHYDLTYPEIASAMGITVKAVERLMSRALHVLRARLAQYL